MKPNSFVHERVRFAPSHERARVPVQPNPEVQTSSTDAPKTSSDNPRLSTPHCFRKTIRPTIRRGGPRPCAGTAFQPAQPFPEGILHRNRSPTIPLRKGVKALFMTA